jgi:hypothetical protein
MLFFLPPDARARMTMLSELEGAAAHDSGRHAAEIHRELDCGHVGDVRAAQTGDDSSSAR